MTCTQRLDKNCDRGHKTRVQCSDRSRPCPDCIKEDNDVKRRAQRDLKLEQQRRAKQAMYEKEREQVRDELDHERRLMKYQTEETENKKILEQEKATLKQTREARVRTEEQKKRQEEQAGRRKATQERLAQKKKDEDTKSEKEGQWSPPETAEEEWTYLKKNEGEVSVPLDELMRMIGLQSVKAQFLSTKNRVDTTIRQDISLAKERFSCSLLGNPVGTPDIYPGTKANQEITGHRKNHCGSYLRPVSDIRRRYSRLQVRRDHGLETRQHGRPGLPGPARKHAG